MSGGLKRVGMAVIGLGRAGQIHFNNVVRNSRIELKWVIEQNQDLARSSLQTYGLDRHVKIGRADDFESLLRDKTIDAVVISTPTDTHADLTIQALRKVLTTTKKKAFENNIGKGENAGKHVMCEKPISEETSKIISCFNEADKYGKVLMATFNRKFDASYRAIYNNVRSGELGDIHLIRSTFRDAPLWLGAHTLSQTFLCHDIDILCWMADGLPETAVCTTTAYTKELVDKNDVDTLVATLKFPSGAIGVLDFSRHSCYGYDIRLEVFGSRGMLTMDAATQHDMFTHKSNGKLHPPLRISFPDRFEKAYVEELDHFIDVIQGKSELFVPRAASERVAYVNDALWESFKTGEVVHLRDKQYT